MYWCNLQNFKNIRVDTRCKTEVEQFFQVIGDDIFAYDQEFMVNIVDATFFIKMQVKLYNTSFRDIQEGH